MEFIDYLKNKTPISEKLLHNLEDRYRNLEVNEKQVLWQDLDEFFVAAPDAARDYWFSYFRWYTDLSWKFFNNMDRDFLADMAVRQIPMAIILDFDVWDKLMRYFNLQILDRQDLASLYTKMRINFLESDGFLGKWNDKDLSISDIVKEIEIINSGQGGTMEHAEFRTKLQQTLLPKGNPYLIADPEVGTDRFIDLVQFFQDVDEKKVWFVMDVYLHPEKYPAEDKEAPANPVPDETKPVPTQIKSQIESQFKKTPQGDFENLEGVFAKLEELSKKYKDPKIAELYYFDETDGNFKWAA